MKREPNFNVLPLLTHTSLKSEARSHLKREAHQNPGLLGMEAVSSQGIEEAECLARVRDIRERRQIAPLVPSDLIS